MIKSKKLEFLEKERMSIFERMAKPSIENNDIIRELFENSAQLNLEKINCYKLNSRIHKIKRILS